jgi:hypothetical protein
MPQNAPVVMDGAGPRRICRIPRQLRQDPDMTSQRAFRGAPEGSMATDIAIGEHLRISM